MTLADFITPKLIELQMEVCGWEEAVRMGGKLLLNERLCEARYINAMVQAVHDLGPYMVLAPGIALAHARPDDGMLKTGMSLITLSTPVEFGNEANDPVHIVISFGGTDNKIHLEMIRSLATFLIEERNQDVLKTARCKQELMNLIHRVTVGEA